MNRVTRRKRWLATKPRGTAFAEASGLLQRSFRRDILSRESHTRGKKRTAPLIHQADCFSSFLIFSNLLSAGTRLLYFLLSDRFSGSLRFFDRGVGGNQNENSAVSDRLVINQTSFAIPCGILLRMVQRTFRRCPFLLFSAAGSSRFCYMYFVYRLRFIANLSLLVSFSFVFSDRLLLFR